MPRHHVTLSPDENTLIVSVAGLRTNAAAEASIAEVIALRESSGVERILFDTCEAITPRPPEALMARALDCGRRLARSRVAILACDAEGGYARLWRKGLVETGHEAMVFTDAASADAWLATRAEAETVYLP